MLWLEVVALLSSSTDVIAALSEGLGKGGLGPLGVHPPSCGAAKQGCRRELVPDANQ